MKLPIPLEEQPYGRTYILAAGETRPEPPTAFYGIADRLGKDACWRVESLPTGHDIMVTMPRELTEILLSLAD